MRAGAHAEGGKWMAATLTSTAETSRRDLPGKQNSLKQLNVTQEKINNGKKKNKEEERKSGGGRRRRKRRKETSHTPDSHYAAKKKGAWFLLRLLKQREIYRIGLIYRTG